MDNEEKVVVTRSSANNGTNWPIIIVVILVVAGLLWFMSQKDNKSQPAQIAPTNPPKESMEEESAEPSTAVTADQAQSITVSGSNFKFEPNEIRVKKGEKVTITFKNAGGFHDFVIPDLDVKTKQIKDGESETVEFTPGKTGSYEFYCSVGNHRAMGMKGTLIVE